MTMLDEIKKQIADLMAYYPGRGRVALLWLIVIPNLFFVMFTVWFGKFTIVTSGGIPAFVFYMAGHSVNWIYTLSLVMMLIRICHSERKHWRDTVQIIVSSLSYSLLVGLPFVLMTFFWSFFYAGTSAMAVFQAVAGLVFAVGALLLLHVVIASLVHRFVIMIPLLLFLTTLYTYLLPTYFLHFQYMSHYKFVLSFAVPLSPTIPLLRDGMLNQGFSSGDLWLAAFIHAFVGYAIAYWIWKKNTEPECHRGRSS